MKAVSPKSTFDYVPKCDRELPKEEQTVFECGFLTVEQEAYLEDQTGKLNSDGSYQITVGSTNLLALNLGLKAIRNLLDENGNAVVLKRDETRSSTLPGVGRPWKSSILSKIPKLVRDEIADAIKAGGQLSEDEKKI